MADISEVIRWVGTANDGDWNTAANWSLVSGGPVHIPGVFGGADTCLDTVLFDQSIGTNAGPTLNYNRAPDATHADFKALYIGPAYNGEIGTQAHPIELSINNGAAAGAECIIDASGAKDVCITGHWDAGAPIQRIADCRIIGKQTSTSYDTFLAGVFYDLTCLCGRVILAAATTINNHLWIGYLTQRTTDVSLLIPVGVTLTAAATVPVEAVGGTVACGIAITTLTLSGGEWTQGTPAVPAALTTLNQTGGTCYMQGSTLTTAHVTGGTLSGAASATAKTFATVILYPGATFDMSNGMTNTTITNWIQNFGGTIIFDDGQKVTLTV